MNGPRGGEQLTYREAITSNIIDEILEAYPNISPVLISSEIIDLYIKAKRENMPLDAQLCRIALLCNEQNLSSMGI